MSRDVAVRLAILSFALPLVAGCVPFVPVFYAYPTISYIPSALVEAPRDEVHVFRVDATNDSSCIEFANDDMYVLYPISPTKGGTVPFQAGVSMDHGWVWNCLALIYASHTHHTIMVRLYRPGWRTVELCSWNAEGDIVWKEARTLQEQEKAVDDLLSTWREEGSWRLKYRRPLHDQEKTDNQEPPNDSFVFYWLAPGSQSSGHRRAMLFAASEYERLSHQSADWAIQRRLTEKASWLREQSAK